MLCMLCIVVAEKRFHGIMMQLPCDIVIQSTAVSDQAEEAATAAEPSLKCGSVSKKGQPAMTRIC